MKTKLLFIVFLSFAFGFAQQGINYKAIVSDNGSVMQNQSVTIYFSILENGTTTVYEENHSLTTNNNGLIITNIGEGSVSSGSFANIDWSKEQFLKVQIDTGSGLTDLGITAFKNVPYALFAKTSDGVSSSGLSDANKILITDASGNSSWEDKSSVLIQSELEKITEGGNTGYRLLGMPPFNYGDIGNLALDLSYNDISNNNTLGATGEYAVALGRNTYASGLNTTAMGYTTNATNDYAMAFGYETEAFGKHSTTFGANTRADGDYATAMGTSTIASGDYSTVLGFGSKATGEFTTAMGLYTEAIGAYSIAMGRNTKATGLYSMAMGRYTVAESYMQTTIGMFNNEVSGSPNSLNSNDRLFVIGNGTSLSNRNDAMVVLKNGNTTINGNLDVNEINDVDSGDADMKAYIYGLVTDAGAVNTASSDGFTVTKTGVGEYRVVFDNPPAHYSNYMVVSSLHGGIGFVKTVRNNTYIAVSTYDTAGVASDKYFNFVVFKK